MRHFYPSFFTLLAVVLAVLTVLSNAAPAPMNSGELERGIEGARTLSESFADLGLEHAVPQPIPHHQPQPLPLLTPPRPAHAELMGVEAGTPSSHGPGRRLYRSSSVSPYTSPARKSFKGIVNKIMKQKKVKFALERADSLPKDKWQEFINMYKKPGKDFDIKKFREDMMLADSASSAERRMQLGGAGGEGL